MPFPNQDYFRLEVIEKQWSISHDDVMYAVENDMLRVCAWLPKSFVERGKSKNSHEFHVISQDHYEGLVRIRPKDCHLLFQEGQIYLNHFLPVEETKYTDIRIANEPAQPPLKVCTSNLLVTNDSRTAFETKHNIRMIDDLPLFSSQRHAQTDFNQQPKNGKETSSFLYNNGYRHVNNYDEDFHLGFIQAKIVEQLHLAYENGDPWVYGKVLLHNVGSQCNRMRDVFKSQPNWQHLIESDGKGHYRLRTA